MDFSPYHRFAECGRLERKVNSCSDNGTINQDVYNEFGRYHFTVIHKLRSACFSLNKLKETLSGTPVDVAINPDSDFHFDVNRLVDSYFYCSGSALDVFARETLVLFGVALPDRVYFSTAHDSISRHRPGDPILGRLAIPTWKSEFSDYRNTLTHELIITPSFTIQVENSSGQSAATIVFPLPDDPRALPQEREYRRNRDVVEYMDTNIKRILRLINAAYSEYRTRIVNGGGQIPIQ